MIISPLRFSSPGDILQNCPLALILGPVPPLWPTAATVWASLPHGLGVLFASLSLALGSPALELPCSLLVDSWFCWSTLSGSFLRTGTQQVKCWRPYKCLYSTLARDSLSGSKTQLWESCLFMLEASSLQRLVTYGWH